jgi:hypothetical protein
MTAINRLIPTSAPGSVQPYNGLAINIEAGIAMFAIANPYGRFGEVPLRWGMTAIEPQSFLALFPERLLTAHMSLLPAITRDPIPTRPLPKDD